MTNNINMAPTKPEVGSETSPIRAQSTATKARNSLNGYMALVPAFTLLLSLLISMPVASADSTIYSVKVTDSGISAFIIGDGHWNAQLKQIKTDEFLTVQEITGYGSKEIKFNLPKYAGNYQVTINNANPQYLYITPKMLTAKQTAKMATSEGISMFFGVIFVAGLTIYVYKKMQKGF